MKYCGCWLAFMANKRKSLQHLCWLHVQQICGIWLVTFLWQELPSPNHLPPSFPLRVWLPQNVASMYLPTLITWAFYFKP